ncbi:MAG: type II toxin-antitoxin system PemK/MazF family toxin [Candidatus Aminicenantes bacterium]|nr:type II toxin-antitoxin system PemK/MazF family toxin [Candidatus Aminicenantes bacterium]
MRRGTIILTRFPFTDLSSSKRRPAVIISNVSPTKPDVIVAFISSVIPGKLSKTDYLLDVDHKKFLKIGLRKKSVFKMDKLATLNKSIFSGELGNLPTEILWELEKKLKIALSLNRAESELEGKGTS